MGWKQLDEKKRKQLGMPFGTACGRLKKSVLFHVLKKHNENLCFKCKREIASVEELTIDHKVPWLHAGADLFWDMDNIAFSHAKCNVVDRPGKPIRIQLPDGQSWCSRCKLFKDVDMFYRSPVKATQRWNGCSYRCKKCENQDRMDRRKRTGK